jgi:formylglycine-generating enzyme required for sulfatase activity
LAVLFVSHSTKDDSIANTLEEWLRGRGFSDIFVEHSNILGGEKWAQALREAARACRVVVCIVTENWLASDDCFAEFRAAWYLGKRIIPLLAHRGESRELNDRLTKLLAEDQGINLGPCLTSERRLDLSRDPAVERKLEMGLRAAGALTNVGLDPGAFATDYAVRPTPFPGLASFGDDDADAAIFYGRSREIADTLEDLRQIRAVGDRRPYAVLGASGAGKSSLLKAGIIPRLRRETPAWLPLRAFRPGADPLLNFAEALARSLADFGRNEAHGTIRDRLRDAWYKVKYDRDDKGELTLSARGALEQALEAEGDKLRKASDRWGSTIVVSIDQAEELVRAEGDSGDALADYLNVTLPLETSAWQLVFTVRTDSFSELQSHPRFQHLKARVFDLRAIPIFRFDSVVEEPAKRYGVVVEDALVYELMEDAPKEDALPLLAFALQRLWRQYAVSGRLSKDSYLRVGGLQGLIEDAAERALRGFTPEEDVPLPAGPPPRHRVDLAASTFIPGLAQINDRGITVRRVASWSSFDEEQQDLLSKFDRWRLVVRKGTELDGGTVEVSHETLFREWGRLKSWFEPERARLEALRLLEIDAFTWDRNGRNAEFLNHRDKRLAEAITLARIPGYRKRISLVELDYLDACLKAEELAFQGRRRFQMTVGILFVAIGVGILSWAKQDYITEQFRWYAILRPYAKANFANYVLPDKKERSLKPLDPPFRECAKNCPEMIVIPAGEFEMGSPPEEEDHVPSEGKHKVVFARSFAVAKFDTTFDEWDACASVGWCVKADDLNMGRGRKPVIMVSWEDAQQYVAWLSKMTERPYRLLTEAEWEYAARAGTSTAYYWGDKIGHDNANCASCGTIHSETTSVGSFKPNAFGLYDMAGNVWQWVEDCLNDSYEDAPTDGSAWKIGDCSRHVARGGGWKYYPMNLRSAYRGANSARNRLSGLGFRVARTLLN